MNTTIKLDTIIRTVCLVLALINQALSLTGHSLLPISDEQVNEAITLGATIAASLWAWWKNNSFTRAAIQADEVKDNLKAGGTLEWEEVDE